MEKIWHLRQTATQQNQSVDSHKPKDNINLDTHILLYQIHPDTMHTQKLFMKRKLNDIE